MDVPPIILGKTSGKTSGKILAALEQDGNLTIPELASLIGVTERSIERNIKKLQKQGRLRREDPLKGMQQAKGYVDCRRYDEKYVFTTNDNLDKQNIDSQRYADAV